VVGRPGSQCRSSRGSGGGFGAGDEVVVAVVDSVGNVDGGCACVVSGDVAGDGIGRSEVFAIVDVLDLVSLAGVKQSVGRAEKRTEVKQSR
jgi:hypothetical protein